MQGLRSFYTKTESLITNNWYPVTLGLFSFPLWCLFVAVFGFIVMIPITKYHAVVAFLLSLGTIAWTCSWKVKRSIVLSAVFCVLLFLAALPTVFLFESDDIDSFVINRPIAVALARGWNPIYQYNPEDYSPSSINGRNASLHWSIYYCKTDRIVNAVMYSFTGNVYAGNVLQILFTILVFPFCCFALSEIFTLSKWKIILLSVCITMHPVSVWQCFIGKEDGILAACLTILFFGLTAYLKSKDVRTLPFIIGSIIIAANVKFTGVVYVAVFLITVLFPLAVIGLWKKEHLDKKLAGTLVLAVFLSLIAGVNPYFYNIYHHKTPFYPLTTTKEKKGIDFMEDVIKQSDFKNANRIERFIFMHLNPFNIDGGNIRGGKFTVNPLIRLKPTPIGGWFDSACFNRYFSISLLFSIFFFPFMRGKYVWLLFIGVWLTIAVQPHSWFGRYIPQLWMVFVIVAASLLETTQKINLWKKRMNAVVCLMVGLCICQCCEYTKPYVRGYYLTMKNYAEVLRYGNSGIAFNYPQFYNAGKDKRHDKNYIFYCSILPDIFPYSKVNEPLYKNFIGDISPKVMFGTMRFPVYLSPDIEPLPKLTRRDLPQMVKLILQLRIRQFKRVWGLEQPPIPNSIKDVPQKQIPK